MFGPMIQTIDMYEDFEVRKPRIIKKDLHKKHFTLTNIFHIPEWTKLLEISEFRALFVSGYKLRTSWAF